MGNNVKKSSLVKDRVTMIVFYSAICAYLLMCFNLRFIAYSECKILAFRIDRSFTWCW